MVIFLLSRVYFHYEQIPPVASLMGRVRVKEREGEGLGERGWRESEEGWGKANQHEVRRREGIPVVEH